MSSAIAANNWARGRFDARKGPHKLLFGRMHEDAAIELNAFRPGGHVFCIASAGCTAIKLAAVNSVVAVDINPAQLAYAEQRARGGPMKNGAAERFLAFLHALAPLAGWHRSRVRDFLDLDDPNEQIAHWRHYLDTKRFRIGLNMLLSRRALRLVYSDSLLRSLPPDLGTVIRARLERGLRRHANRTNPYAPGLFLGKTDNESAFPGTVSKTAQIRFAHADAAGYLERPETENFDGFALSNIFDGADNEYRQRLVAALKKKAAPDAMVVIRSFWEPRTIAPTNRAADDRSMVWGIVDVRSAASL